MSIMEYTGGSVVAMVGKNCVGIASDLRMGQQAMLVSPKADKVFQMTERTYIGLPGLATDTFTLRDKFRHRVSMYKLKEEREIEPQTFAHLVSSTLYERRFGPYFVEPVIAGLSSPDSDTPNQPFIAASDLIGCLNFAKDFVVSGTASDKLFGMAEGLWEEDMNEDQLFEALSQTLLGALERDALSQGAVVRVITPTRVVERTLRARAD